MSQISESKTKLVWILPSVRDFARRAMSQISDSRSFRGSGRSAHWMKYAYFIMGKHTNRMNFYRVANTVFSELEIFSPMIHGIIPI